MVRDNMEWRRCHVCWERGHISMDCPVRQGLLHLANMAAELNDRIRRPVPIRVYRVNTHRRHYRPPRRRHNREQNSERNHTGRHELPPRPVHVNSELNYEDRGPYHRDVHGSRPAHPPADNKENIRPAPPANPAHLQTSVAYDRHGLNMRLDSSIATPGSSALATDTKMESESGNPIEHSDNPSSDYLQTSGAVDVQTLCSDTLTISSESGTRENLPSLSFNVSGDIVMTGESQAVVDDYCSELLTIV
ncbi:hypothetical protein BDV40DRAFT_300257 [Aspergillus tamarii]|uniref:CCHC-type domain-containing protein n=1 Tax=Aspergillus tamarii TaxID=41984 RepID=A0A5N6UXA2_ASPTM|nr:hypothetical protein BDV40DRAFT_300257 [Aspergillus tamarii]